MVGQRTWPRLLMHSLLLVGALSSSALPEDAKKLWSLDLSTNQDFQRRLRKPEVVLDPPTVDFLNDKQVIVSFEDDDPWSPDPDREPFGFYVLEVGANSGVLGRKLSFEVLTASQALTAANGTFLVLAGEKLKKFSDSFKEIAAVPTPLRLHGRPTKQWAGGRFFLNAHYETWQMDVAPGGEEVVLAHVENPKETEFRWLRTTDFSTVATAQVERFRWRMSAGNQAVLSSGNPDTMLISPSRQTSICARCARAYFINDDLIFLDQDNKYEIRSASGKSYAIGKLQHGAFMFKRAANATRFVYPTGAYKGWGFPLLTHFAAHTEINIFDWTAMKQIAQVKLSEPEKAVSSGFSLGAIAISPDGRLLIILNDSNLSCYEVR